MPQARFGCWCCPAISRQAWHGLEYVAACVAGSLAQQPLGVGLRQRQADGVVPDLFSPAAKRQRAA